MQEKSQGLIYLKILKIELIRVGLQDGTVEGVMMTDELTDGELAQAGRRQDELSYLLRVIALDQIMLPEEIQALLGLLIKQNDPSLYVVLLLVALLDPCLQVN